MGGLHLDFETRSTTDLRRTGVHRYVEDRNTSAWCFAYQIDNGPIDSWLNGFPIPKDVVEHVFYNGKVIAHNAAFELAIWNYILRRDYPDIPKLKIEQLDCTMVRALALNLPGDLDNLAKVLQLPHQKDMEGNALIKKMAKPRSVKDGVITWWDDPHMVLRGLEYCCQDIRTEHAADDILWPLQPGELELWHIDLRINQRGIPIDLDLVRRAVELVEYARRNADIEMQRLTSGMVQTCGQRDNLIDWLATRGIFTDTLRKGDQDDLLLLTDVYDDPLARQVLELRRQASKTSTAKYEKILECVCADGHVRDTLQFCGAAQTGRWAGRLVQTQNYPRVADDEEAAMVEQIVGLVKDTDVELERTAELIELIGPPKLPNGDKANGTALLPWLSKCLRSTIAGPRMVGGDYSNIEGRINAWLAGEEWKIKAFEEYDAGTGPDLYRLAFSTTFGIPIDLVTKYQRQIGKVEELALGYQGGVGAFVSMVNTYFIKLFELTAAVKAITDPQTWAVTAAKWELARDKHGLTQDVWTACKLVVTKWRKANAMIVQGWWDLADAAINAVMNVGAVIPCYQGRVSYYCDGNYLMCYLPSGRYICYPAPYVAQDIVEQIYTGLQWVDVAELDPVILDQLILAGYKVVERKRMGVRFHRWHNHAWVRAALYGGYQCENIVQATARDVMAYAMRKAEAANFPLCLTVHDELLSLLRSWYGGEAEYKQLLMQRSHWTAGLPVVATVWSGDRYTK